MTSFRECENVKGRQSVGTLKQSTSSSSFLGTEGKKAPENKNKIENREQEYY